VTRIEARGVYASYGRTRVLNDVDLHLDAGEMLAVLGPSGCGKTTLLRAIAGLHRIDAGVIVAGTRVLARPPAVHVDPERRRVGLMPQEGALFPHLTVRRNVEFGLVPPLLRRRRGGAAARRRRVDELLELVGLADSGDARPQELSGGQQQRVALARALAPRPDVVLMDEPFASLDPALRAGIRTEVKDMLKADDTPAILVTHDRAEAMSVADRLTILRAGRTLQTGTPVDVYRNPVSPDVGAFIGDAVIVEASARGAAADTLFGPVRVAGAVGGPVDGRILIRPEQIEPAADPDGRFVVARVVFAGGYSLVTITDPRSGTTGTALVRGASLLDVGGRVSVRVTGEAAFFPSSVPESDDECEHRSPVPEAPSGSR